MMRAKDEEHKYWMDYECPCGEKWSDTWSCACNDKCPKCNKEIEPSDWGEIE